MNEFFASLAERVALTLLHSLWQGALVANATAVALAVASRANPRVRYAIACAGLACLAIAPVIAWCLVETTPRVATTERVIELEPDVVLAPLVAASPPPSFSPLRWGLWLEHACRENAAPLAGAWLFGVAVLTMRLAVAWIGVQRLRRVAGSALSPELAARFAQLVKRMKATPAVKAIVSTRVDVPAAIGWLRPVVLLPARAIVGLDADALERLMAHELAHVVRGDYAVNFLQRLVESVWFHHPAAWWLSHRIREEREFCCDELAVAATGDRHEYARALASLEELQGANADLGLALGSNGGRLMRRVRNILGLSKPVDGSAGAIALATLLVGAAFAWSTWAPRATAQQAETPKPASKDDVKSDEKGRPYAATDDRLEPAETPAPPARVPVEEEVDLAGIGGTEAPRAPDLATLELEAAEAKELLELSQEALTLVERMQQQGLVPAIEVIRVRRANAEAHARHDRAAAVLENRRAGKNLDRAKLLEMEIRIHERRLEEATQAAKIAEDLMNKGEGTTSQALEARREVVVAKYALARVKRGLGDSVVATPDQPHVDDPGSDPNPRVVATYPLKIVSVKQAIVALDAWAKANKVPLKQLAVDERTNSLVVLADPASQKQVADWIKSVDRKPAPAVVDDAFEDPRAAGRTQTAADEFRDWPVPRARPRTANESAEDAKPYAPDTNPIAPEDVVVSRLRQQQAINRELAQLDVEEAELKVRSAEADVLRTQQSNDSVVIQAADAALSQARIGLRRAKLKLKAIDVGLSTVAGGR